MKRLLLVLIPACVFCAARPVAAQVAHDGTGTCSTGTSGSSPLTISHTATGSNLTMFVAILDSANTGNVTDVSYNGISLTENPDSPLEPGGGGNRFVRTYYGSVASGTHNVVVTNGATSTIWVEVCTYSGAATSPEAKSTVTTVNASPTTGTVTVATANAWTVYAVSDTSGTQAASTGSTLYGCSALSLICIYDSNGTQTAGSHSMSITQNAAAEEAGFIFSLAPFTASGGGCYRTLLGVGCDDQAPVRDDR